MIFSTRTALQFLVAVPMHHNRDMLTARELSPEARSVMLGLQEYSRGYDSTYEDDSVLARGFSLLAVRAPSCKDVVGTSKGSKKLTLYPDTGR